MQPTVAAVRQDAFSGFNPHPSRRTGATKLPRTCQPPPTVSILTRPEGRVQPQAFPVMSPVDAMFQSSPVPKDGCNPLGDDNNVWCHIGFNPHPSRRTGATTTHYHPLKNLPSFNPHPSRRTGATSLFPRPCSSVPPFQSSPVPEDGCNTHQTGEYNWNHVVSILTRPGGRVQLSSGMKKSISVEFQSSPVPEDGCNGRQRGYAHLECVSILTRPGGRVQRRCVVRPVAVSGFQSSPVPEDGCNAVA